MTKQYQRKQSVHWKLSIRQFDSGYWPPWERWPSYWGRTACPWARWWPVRPRLAQGLSPHSPDRPSYTLRCCNHSHSNHWHNAFDSKHRRWDWKKNILFTSNALALLEDFFLERMLKQKIIFKLQQTMYKGLLPKSLYLNCLVLFLWDFL